MHYDPPQFIPNPLFLDVILNQGGDSTPQKLFPGIYQIRHFSGDIALCGTNMPMERSYFALGNYYSYGVVDSPAQFKELVGPLIEADPRPIVAFLTHMPKQPENAGKGGGWRWHKWGEYIGTGDPQCEYLDDEPEFEDGIYTYHFYDCTDLKEGRPAY